MYINLAEISMVQLDHTSRCNLSCPQCARTQNSWSSGSNNKNLDLTIDDYKIIFEPLKENLKIFHCGNYGDAIASPTFNETFTYSLSRKPKEIKIATNGSLRSEDWWRELAMEGGSRVCIDFAIDGMDDTYSTYRVGGSWDKIIKNATAFIKAGGAANWNFIEFKHNSHQLETAKQMAKDLGFREFRAKTTARFINDKNNGIATNQVSELQNTSVRQQFNKIVQTEKFANYLEETPVTCKFKQQRAIFVDMNMNLWPCCWFGVLPYSHTPMGNKNAFDELNAIFGINFLNLRVHGWKVLENEFYLSYLEKTWISKSHPRIHTCGKVCGEKFEHSSGYGSNIRVDCLG